MPIQQAVSDSSGVTLHGAAHSERTAATVTVLAQDEAAQARASMAVPERGQAEPEDGEIKDGEDAWESVASARGEHFASMF